MQKSSEVIIEIQSGMNGSITNYLI